MSPDDTESDEESSDASGGGQPRDPETGQFLSKDQREAASDGDEKTAESGADEAADEPESEEDAGDERARADAAPRTSRSQSPKKRDSRAPPMVVRRTDLGTDGPGAAGRSSEPRRRPPLPPSLDLVPQQVALNGEPVEPIRGLGAAPQSTSPRDRPPARTAPAPSSGTAPQRNSARTGPAPPRPNASPSGPGLVGDSSRRHETGGPPQ